MKMKHMMAIGVAVVVAIVGALFFCMREGPSSVVATKAKKSARKPLLVQKNAETSAVKPVGEGTSGKSESKEKKDRRVRGQIGSGDDDGIFRDSNGKPYPEADQLVMSQAAEAVDNDDVAGARSLVEAALASENRDLREAVVDALGWFSEDTMMELVPFFSDPDEDIAEAAQSHWMDGLRQMEDDGEKAGVIEVSLKAIKNKDKIGDIMNELIGIDELAAVQVVVNVIEGGGVATEAAKEVYNSITGEDWKDVDAAEEWLQENYVAPDDD